MDYKNLIPKIKSVRDYKADLVSPQILDEIKSFYQNERKLIEGIDVDVIVKDREDVFEQLKGIAGYKENMIDAPHYLIVASNEGDYYIENTGYICENIMLKAFELGVGSCWITFKNGDEIKKKLNFESEKKLTAIIALGYDNNKTKIVYDNVSEYNPSRADIKVVEDNTSYRLDVEEVVYIGQWGNNATADDLSNRGILEGFTYARLAPSTLNRQPWRFIVDDGIIVLALRSDAYVNNYEAKIDTGIIMLFFESVIDATLLDVEWNIGKPEKEYNIPDEYSIVGYCNL
ncbi:nitroreductase [Sedimentibacter acidaminivorans]|jgi:nitroreductase|uniref:Nitroreductase n=1 Tax=Sedimentibacter acidaminivorans TaxID=913099 RepID=A0ABS4GH19_9FIRM|nr:nitroreductase family protein [Sedimentibacter acidaminivorans]MBP1926998.1 nitroreductase [Sedimentibacter acidaminivorans]